jgi:tetratricopeptide (TPR) repeat protein
LAADIPFGAIQQLSVRSQSDPATAIRLADLYQRLGEPEMAVASLVPFVKNQNPSVDLLWALLQAHTQAGDFIEAGVVAHDLLPSFSTLSEERQQTIVRTLLLAGDYHSVEALLPPKTDSTDWLNLNALFWLVQDKPNEVVRTLSPLRKNGSLDAFGAFLLGLAYEQANDTSDAIVTYGKALELPDSLQETSIRLGRLLVAKHRTDDAMVTINRLPKAAKNLPDYWEVTEAAEHERNNPIGAAISHGYALFWGGDPRGAEALWQKILPTARGDDKKELFAALHNSAFKREDAPAALQWANRGLAAFPDDLFFSRRRAESLLGLGQIEDSRKQALELQKKAPAERQASIAELLCRIGLDGGMPELLQENAKRCRELDTSDTQALFHLAEAEEKKGATSENRRAALADYEEVLKIDPKNADAMAHIGLLQAELNDAETAERTLLMALSLYPRVLDGAPHAVLAQLYQKRGRADETRFHVRLYETLRRDKERWPSLLKGLRQDLPLADWKELAALALERRENWIARCAIHGGLRLSPQDSMLLRSLATVEKRDGRFLSALHAVQEARKAGSQPALTR